MKHRKRAASSSLGKRGDDPSDLNIKNADVYAHTNTLQAREQILLGRRSKAQQLVPN